MGDRANLWVTIPALPTAAVCYQCKERPSDLVQCERCGRPVCPPCYWRLCSDDEWERYRADDALETCCYVWLCEFCRS